jgi:carnitine 3-dehydrogenase
VALVEVVGGAKTAPEALDWAVAFYTAIGKRPIRLRREIIGHVANRLTAALWREAIHLVAEGVASVEDVDTAVTCGPGLRWAVTGPYLTYHLGGGEGGLARFFEHLGPGQERRWKTLGKPRLTPKLRAQLVRGVEQEVRGRPVAELAGERDACLAAALKALASCRGSEPPKGQS